MYITYIVRNLHPNMITSISSIAEYNEITSKERCVIDCKTDWCGPCQTIFPKFEKLSKLYPNWKFYRIDCEEHKDVADKEQITGFPTFIFFEDGEKTKVIRGADIHALEDKLSS